MTSSFTSISSEQAELNRELRSYAQRMPVTIVQTTLEEAIAALEPHFPDLTKEITEVQMLLDAVGISVIVDTGLDFDPERMSWSIAASEADAKEQVSRYDNPKFAAIRDSFNIDYHWVFLVPSRSLSIYDEEALIEGSIDYFCDEKPSCWILRRFS